jgi:hypothetical protein
VEVVAMFLWQRVDPIDWFDGQGQVLLGMKNQFGVMEDDNVV